MGLQGEKKATVVIHNGTQVLGPFEGVGFTGGKRTAASSKKRRGAGQARTLRVGAEDVENGTLKFENDGTIPFETLWQARRRVDWYVTVTPADDDGNPRAGDARNYLGKQVGDDDSDVDVENDEDLDYVEVELILKRA